jgi:hypothetical protein
MHISSILGICFLKSKKQNCLPAHRYGLSLASGEKHKPRNARLTLSKWMRKDWTVADIAIESWTFTDLALVMSFNSLDFGGGRY